MILASVILIVAVLILSIKIFFMKKTLDNITDEIDEIIGSNTNRTLSTLSKDKSVVRLVRKLNVSLKTLRKLKLEYTNGNHELQNSITNLSHDIRTPLTSIRGYLDLMESEGKLNKKYLKVIQNKVEEMSELTEELYDYSSSRDFRPVVESDVVLNKCLEEVIVEFYGAFKKANMTPVIEMCEEKVIRNLDKNRLNRIFENIISNSIKYAEGDLRITLDRDG